jgi:hypothetical protein
MNGRVASAKNVEIDPQRTFRLVQWRIDAARHGRLSCYFAAATCGLYGSKEYESLLDRFSSLRCVTSTPRLGAC